MAHAALHTRLCELVGVEYPIVQTGMGWVAGARLVSAVARAGGLGIIAAGTLGYAELVRAIAETRSRTTRPFGVNLRSDAPDVFERAELMIAEGVKVASFALAPDERLIKRLKDGGVVCIPTVGAPRHAEKVAAWGADAVIAQGAEAGGHTGEIATAVLLPQVVDAVDIPVIAAGGFCDGRGLVAALALGAVGIAMGTRFLLTRDSPVPDAIKQVYLSKRATDTVRTMQVDGMPHRVLRTELVDRLERKGLIRRFGRALANAVRFKRMSGTSWEELIREAISMKRTQELDWSQVVMAANAPMLLRKTMVEGDPSAGVMAGGQVVGRIGDLPGAAELIERIVAEAEATLERLASGQGTGRRPAPGSLGS